MNIFKVLPDLKKERQMALFHKALRSQWSAEDVDWGVPHRLRKPMLKDQLARVLTPLLMGEQSAFYSLSTIIPILGHRFEVESQMFLTSMALDEARHTELVARFYRRLDREPLSIRRLPAAYLFQAKIVSKEPTEWLVGSLVSEVLAKLTLEELRRIDLDPVLSDIADRVLVDEARHLGFNHVFFEDHFAGRLLSDEDGGAAFLAHLEERLDDVLGSVPPMLSAVDADLRAVGFEPDELLARLRDDTRRRLRKSCRAARRDLRSGAATAGGADR